MDKTAGIDPELGQGDGLERDLKMPIIYEHFNERNNVIDVIIVQKGVLIRSRVMTQYKDELCMKMVPLLLLSSAE